MNNQKTAGVGDDPIPFRSIRDRQLQAQFNHLKDPPLLPNHIGQTKEWYGKNPDTFSSRIVVDPVYGPRTTKDLAMELIYNPTLEGYIPNQYAKTTDDPYNPYNGLVKYAPL